jgi:hypothetical protein
MEAPHATLNVRPYGPLPSPDRLYLVELHAPALGGPAEDATVAFSAGDTTLFHGGLPYTYVDLGAPPRYWEQQQVLLCPCESCELCKATSALQSNAGAVFTGWISLEYTPPPPQKKVGDDMHVEVALCLTAHGPTARASSLRTARIWVDELTAQW